jgi:diamine N-acetyltransferase
MNSQKLPVLKLIRVHLDSAPLVQEILEAAPRYTQNTEGVESIPTDGVDSLKALPPGCTLEQKLFMVAYRDDQAIGVIDLIRGFPDSETAFLGLLLLRETHQNQGLGKSIYEATEKVAINLGLKKIRLAVVDSNPVQIFWKKMGFLDIGIARPHEGRNIKSTKRVLEKLL